MAWSSVSLPSLAVAVPFPVRVDRPLERVGGTPVVRATALAELGDHPSPSLGRAILPQLELRPPADDLELHGGELSHRPSIKRFARVERPESPFRLGSREHPPLLRRYGLRILGDPRLALDDHRPVVTGRRSPGPRMRP